jgi:hypothetical protein
MGKKKTPAQETMSADEFNRQTNTEPPPVTPPDCPGCLGKGKIERSDDFGPIQKIDCEQCHGTGRLMPTPAPTDGQAMAEDVKKLRDGVGANNSIPLPAPAPEANILHKIQEYAEVVRDKEAVYERSKKETSRFKKDWEAAVATLMKLIEQSNEDTPLFDGIDVARPVVDLDTDEAWKDEPLENVFGELPKGLQKKIAEAELKTMGDITEYVKHKRLIDIPGVGETSATRIEEALEAFWERRKNAAPAVQEPLATAAPLEEGDGKATEEAGQAQDETAASNAG